MYELKLYDRTRRPANWTDVIGRDEFAVFAKHVENGETLDTEARPFATVGDVTCVVFETLEAAERFCLERVERLPCLRLEIFDAEGRRHPPLLVVVNARYGRKLPAHPWNLRLRSRIAAGLLVAAPPLVWFDLWHAEGKLIFPTFIGLNLFVVAMRLVHLNWCARTAERARQERWQQAVRRAAVQPIG